ncbi:hypothetical protein B0H10DRAFT_2105542 [Mycena sp. CBHHK59/15]|nr:hypothetical protein B0H10DRAFT_2105542 [Mycena sp. CBHHK59/15]
MCVWRTSWSLSKILFLFSRYSTVVALGFFLMEAIGTRHFLLPLNVDDFPSGVTLGPSFYAPCEANLKVRYSRAARWYLGLTEVLHILTGELIILIRINAVYGWSRRVVVLTLLLFFGEAVVGLVTTILSVLGGSTKLLGSSNILSCVPGQLNVPDVNISMSCTSMAVACVYLGLFIQKATSIVQTIEDAEGTPRVRKASVFAALRASQIAPTLHVCLRDAAFYFLVIFAVLLLNLVLILVHDRYAQLGTPWLLATYTVASTRIFLNLKGMSLGQEGRDGATWSEFQRNSALEFRVQSELCTFHGA